MEIQKKVKRVRLHALVTPETMQWLEDQHELHEASYGELLDSLVVQEREKDDAR